MSRHLITKDYIMVLQKEYHCTGCGEKYKNADARHKWCLLCHLNYLKNNVITGENEIIKGFIQETLSKSYDLNDIVFECIPYSQFNSIEKIGEGDFSIVYSAIWNISKYKYKRLNNDS